MRIDVSGDFSVIAGRMIRGTYRVERVANPTTGHLVVSQVACDVATAPCDRNVAQGLIDAWELIDTRAASMRRIFA